MSAKPSVKDVANKNRAVKMAWKRIATTPDLQPAMEWLESIYDSPLKAGTRECLERQVGRRDVARDIKLMVNSEVGQDVSET